MPQSFEQYRPVTNHNTFVSEQRYAFANVVIDGQQAFLKQATSPEVVPKLERELLWHDYMADFSAGHPDLRTRSPEIISAESDYILFEQVEAPFLGTVDDVSLLEPEIPRLAKLLVAMDSFASTWASTRVTDTLTDNAPFDAIDRSWRKWAASPVAGGIITERMILEAEGILDTFRHRLAPRMQHGDFTPWHIFNKEGEWLIFDGENSSVNKARFYDLAYFYSRVFTRGKNHELASRLLREFVSAVDVPEQEFLESFLPLITSRSLGVFLDAAHDKEQSDYTDDAIELFERCKARDLDALTET